MYDIMYLDQTAREHGLHIKKRPDIPVAEREYSEYQIPGRDGKLYEDLKTVEDIEINIDFNFMSTEKDWSGVFRAAKRWLLGAKGKLILGDDQDFFYRVKKVSFSDGERTSLRIGNFTVTFICEGYAYLQDGTREYEIGNVQYNPYETCKPIYFIRGEGVCTLTINRKAMTANVGKNLTINTDLMLAYREDGSLMNTAVSGDYEDLYLYPGENEISITDGFELKVIPNWRCY